MASDAGGLVLLGVVPPAGSGPPGAVVVVGLVLVAMLVGQATTALAGNELAGPLAVLVLVCAGFVALIVWLDIDAVRNLSPGRREHQRLDVARIVATVVFVIFAGTTFGANIANPKSEIGEAAIFAMAAGIFAAVLTAVADATVTLAERRARGTD